MKSFTLLLDLDNTLLDTNMEAFLPAYFEALAAHLKSQVAPEAMLKALRSGLSRMLVNNDPSRTLQEVFEDDFYAKIGIPPQEIRPAIQKFYDEIFPTLGSMTRPKPGAREFVSWALAAGHQVALATDPLFPRQATYERVRWAGLDPLSFDLVASFESFHFSKSNAAYFAEFVGRLGWPDRPIIMAGDDIERDIAPAQALGLTTYHVDGVASAAAISALPDPPPVSSGDLATLKMWLEHADLEPFAPSSQDRAAILAILAATPAVLEGLVADLSPESWSREPSPDDWAMIELVCHLRDTEREVHALQLRTLLESPLPFVPRPDAAVWAKQRRYLQENGVVALQEFTAARMMLLRQLDGLPAAVWQKPARHAIFGPTDFQEVIGFMGDHDRMHLQQAWGTLEALGAPAHRS